MPSTVISSSNIEGPPFKCFICGSTHNTRRGLNIHKNKSARCKNSTQLNANIPFNSFTEQLLSLKSSTRLLRRIPKASRRLVAFEYSKTLDRVTSRNDVESWEQLLLFPYRALALPNHGKPKNASLASIIRNNLSTDTFPHQHQTERHFKPSTLEHKVESKLSEGDLSGAMRLLTTDDSLAVDDAHTLETLRLKHPAAQSNLDFPPPPDQDAEALQVSQSDIRKAILSFPVGSAGGLDGLRPQHLKDLTAPTNAEALLRSLVAFVNLLLSGSVPTEICPLLYGAALTAISKKDGGIRPIAVGNTLRRLTAKVACSKVSSQAGSLLRPFQLGVGTPGGIEAAVHAARKYILNSQGARAMVKIDFANAFNSVRRDWMLREIQEKFPCLYPFLYQCYRTPATLAFGENIISSEVGVQQGDPLGPLVFCLAVHHIATSLQSELNIWYMDDVTLSDDPETVISDMHLVQEEGRKIGLEINARKSEVFLYGGSPSQHIETLERFDSSWPGICFLKDEVFLLGSPLTTHAIPMALEQKLNETRLLVERIDTLQAHYALFILKNSLGLPRLLFTLRTCPSWTSEEILRDIDETLRVGLEKVCNVLVSSDTWKQASLPVRDGGLGIRSVGELSLPAYMASVHASAALVSSIVTPRIAAFPDPFLTEAESRWSQIMPQGSPTTSSKSTQRAWTTLLTAKTKEDLLCQASDDKTRGRLLAVSTRESGAWLNAIPSPSLGTLLDNDSLRIAVGLRLGTPLCTPFPCQCGTMVDAYAHHCLSCADLGRRSRHGQLNETVRRALMSAGIPSTLEPPGLSRDDGKRPDGLSLTAWQGGRMLVWDATCSDTLAATYVHSTSRTAGAAANSAERRKNLKYSSLPSQYLFVPLGFETFGPWGDEALTFFKRLAERIFNVTREPRSAAFLRQRLSMDIQRGNAACILSSLPAGASLPIFLF